MKDEIKEILEDLRNKNCYVNNETILTFDEASLLSDYITNLQEENKRLNNIIDELEKFLKYEIYCDFNKEMTKGYQDTLDKLKELKEGK